MPTAFDATEDDGYRIERRDGYAVVYGLIPIGELVPLLEAYEPDGVMDTHLADMLDAAVAVGDPEALASARQREAPACIEAAKRRFADSGLSDEAIEWLAIGEQGLSSRAMFAHITGVAPPRMREHSDRKALPRDAGDFSRCYQLCREVPQVGENLDRLASLSPQWASLAAQWQDLAKLFDGGRRDELGARLSALSANHEKKQAPAP